jgi:hypothetical protein
MVVEGGDALAPAAGILQGRGIEPAEDWVKIVQSPLSLGIRLVFYTKLRQNPPGFTCSAWLA